MVPPVPIPNTVVKHVKAESTWLETAREDRKLPVYSRTICPALDSLIAQSVEQSAVNRSVVGSSPTHGAMHIPWGIWGIAKLVKARDFDSCIRWFESSYPSQTVH